MAVMAPCGPQTGGSESVTAWLPAQLALSELRPHSLLGGPLDLQDAWIMHVDLQIMLSALLAEHAPVAYRTLAQGHWGSCGGEA